MTTNEVERLTLLALQTGSKMPKPKTADDLRLFCRVKLWRLNNLYFIKDKNNKKVRFRMTPEQLDYTHNAHNRNVILKARQLGFTTNECIIQLDAALFEHAPCCLIAHNKTDAERLFREKIKYAYSLLPALIKEANPLINDKGGELKFERGGYVYVSVSARGGTLQRLHISEFGKICAKYPDKAQEIVTGAFEAVPRDGSLTIESTAEGRSGYFFDYSQRAEQNMLSGKELSPLDWKFFFYAWWQNPEYTLDSNEPISLRMEQYFDSLGIELTDGQKRWYQAKEADHGEFMKREYPSNPKEAFEQSLEGAYYAPQFRAIREEKRIHAQITGNDHLPVMTFWDLGVRDSTVIWFVRKLSDTEYHVIDYYENSGEGLRHYLGVLKSKGYNYSEHYAPHDIDNRSLSSDAKSLRQQASEGYEIDGIRYSVDFNVVPQGSVMDGISLVREILPYCHFDEYRCDDGIKHLEAYRKEWDAKHGTWKDRPLHDDASHAADAFRYFAVAMHKTDTTPTITSFGW